MQSSIHALVLLCYEKKKEKQQEKECEREREKTTKIKLKLYTFGSFWFFAILFGFGYALSMSSFVFYTYYFKALNHKTETGFCQICAARCCCCCCCCWASLRQEIKAKQLEIFIGISHKIAKLVFSTYPTLCFFPSLTHTFFPNCNWVSYLVSWWTTAATTTTTIVHSLSEEEVKCCALSLACPAPL